MPLANRRALTSPTNSFVFARSEDFVGDIRFGQFAKCDGGGADVPPPAGKLDIATASIRSLLSTMNSEEAKKPALGSNQAL
jgi:hypothetical protein